MKLFLALLISAVPVTVFSESSDPVFYIRDLKSERDVGAVNQNFRNIADYARSITNRINESTGTAMLTVNQTFTGTITFGSSVTFSGPTSGLVVCSTVNIAANKTTAAQFPSIIAGSTLTITTTGNPVWVRLTARYLASNSGAPNYPEVGFMRDAGYVGGEALGQGMASFYVGAGYWAPVGIDFTDVLAAGNYVYTIAIGDAAASGATTTLAAPINFSVCTIR